MPKNSAWGLLYYSESSDPLQLV